MRAGRLVWPNIVLLIAISALYGQFLWNPIVFDDLPFFKADAQGVLHVWNYQYSLLKLRSLPYATLNWGSTLFGPDVLHFRIENMLLHASVAITLFFFLKRLFDIVYRSRASSLLSSQAIALSAALLFALHPVAVYATGYLVQRSIMMATLFSLLAMLAYLHGSMRNSRFWLWACVPLYYLAVFSKEHAVMLPAVLVVMTMLIHEDWQDKIKQRWGIFAALALIALFVVIARIGVIGSAYEFYAQDMLQSAPVLAEKSLDAPTPMSGNQSFGQHNLNYPLSVVTQSWLFFKYAGLWMTPNPKWMSADMREPFAQSLWSPYLISLFAYLAWGAGAIWLLLKRGRSGLIGMAMLFPWLMFITEFSTIRIQENFVLYRSYLWAVGACCVLPVLLDSLGRKLAIAIVIVVSMALFPISMERLSTFSHPLLLWSDAEKLVKDKLELPGTYRIYYNRGSEYIKIGDYDSAINDMKLAESLNPDWPFSPNNLGLAYSMKSEWRLAAEAYGRAIEIADRKKLGVNARPYFGRAVSLEQLGEIEKAKLDYAVSCEYDNMGCEKLK